MRRALATRLDDAGIENAAREADWMLESVTGIGRAQLLAGPDRDLQDPEVARLLELVERRAAREPLQYILGSTGFYGREFAVSPSALIPRPETELLVEATLSAAPRGGRVLEVGTGSGCVAVTVALERPDLEVIAMDVSAAALEVARKNAFQLGADVRFLEGDAFDHSWMHGLESTVNVVASNPPYVPLADRDTLQRELAFEPGLALFVEDGPGRFIKRLTGIGQHLLVQDGVLLIETHSPEARESLVILADAGYTETRVLQDLSGRPRVLQGRKSG
ncbi:MAG: peptide chain release factor N(5)-glutamine methyltransferase [Rhodothermales bacterium]|nr:peptide chain release factor N(5)-glutamine methyltransferase [Rhodothermales bacterium]